MVKIKNLCNVKFFEREMNSRINVIKMVLHHIVSKFKISERFTDLKKSSLQRKINTYADYMLRRMVVIRSPVWIRR